MPSPTDRIEKEIVLPAPRERVWRALTDVREFNQWFGVALTAPFAPGAVVSRQLASPEYQHLTMTVWVEEMVSGRRFSFRWHPYAIEEGIDYSAEPTTLVSFTLEDVEGGTRLTIVESGFQAIPESRRDRAFRADGEGWAIQLKNVRRYLEEHLRVGIP